MTSETRIPPPTPTPPAPEAAREIFAIPVEIPDLARWYLCSDRVAVAFDDMRKIMAVLRCCDAALVAANDNRPVEGPTYCLLMAQVAHVQGILYDITRRFYEGDVLPDVSRAD